VCGFRRCRQECNPARGSRDCGLGLECFKDLLTDLGYCQLPDELTCTLDSDCQRPCGGDPSCADQLACRDGECGQECASDRDCPSGSMCTETAGVHTCKAAMDELCIYNSHCEPGLICDERQDCRPECDHLDPDPTRDCDHPRVCQLVMLEESGPTPLCVLPDGGV